MFDAIVSGISKLGEVINGTTDLAQLGSETVLSAIAFDSGLSMDDLTGLLQEIEAIIPQSLKTLSLSELLTEDYLVDLQSVLEATQELWSNL